jgi:tetratricopeptide (TPR) repeat protein
MSRPSKSDHKKPEHTESFEERIDLLFEELSFAIQWQRPSILLVFYESEYLRGRAELALEKRLAKIGQQVVQFRVDERHFDIPLLLSQRPDQDCSVYSVTGLCRGGGKEGANAYRALNMRREYFVDHAIRVIIWLAKGEAIELSRHAPDFWAFRHRVVEFNDASDLEYLAIPANELSEGSQGFPDQPGNLDEQIEQNEALIRKLPKQAESLASHLELLSTLASLYRAKHAYDQSIRRSKQGIVIAKQLNNTALLAKLWGNLGAVHLDMDQFAKAIRAFWKAIRIDPKDSSLWIGLGRTYFVQGRLEAARKIFKRATKVNPQDANAWINLGHVFRIEKRFSDAIIAFQQATQLDLQNPSANSSLVACYRLLGKDDLAEEQIKLTRKIMENETEYNKAIFESVCGNTIEAIELLNIALEKKQAGVNWVRHDPNLDFIRDDPGFGKLLGLGDLISRNNEIEK